MISNSSSVSEALSAGATVLTPDAARARTVRRAAGQRALASGLRLWPTPDVLSLGAWFHRELEGARRQGRLRARLLGGTAEWLLWREAITGSGCELGAVSVESLVQPLRRAAFLLEEWQIPLAAGVSRESELLLRASRGFRQRCADLGAMTAASWAQWRLASGQALESESPGVPRAAHAERGDVPSRCIAGFEPLGPQLRSALAAAGTTLLSLPSPPVTPQVHSFPTPESELAGVARWARARLQDDPGARLLIVIPDLGQRAAALRRCLEAALCPEELLDGGVTSVHDLLVPDALGATRLIVTAMNWLRLTCAGLAIEDLSATLCSPFLKGEPSARALIDRRLRELALVEADRATLQALEAAMPATLRTEYAALIAALAPVTAARASCAVWAARFSQWLQRAGWPGDADLAELDRLAYARFNELLREFAMHCEGVGTLAAVEALALFSQLLSQSESLEHPADCAVQVTASLAHPLVRYDGLWVCGLSESTWPAAAAPDPFIPLGLQRAVGIEAATAAGQLNAARRQLAQWQACASELRLSFARMAGDIEQSISPLLAALSPQPAPTHTGYDALTLALCSHGPPPTESALLETGALSPEAVLAGGTRVLELMAQCPFRAHAVQRLHAKELEQPAPGLDAREQGQALHAALQRLWSRIGGLEQARALDAPAASAAAANAAEETIAFMRRQRRSVLPELLWQVETARLAQLLRRELELESRRNAFTVLGTEVRTELALAGATLKLRIDRIDVLADDSLAIIDYKSGRPVSFDSLASPPGYPQLLAYAVAQDRPVSAVAALHLRADSIDWRGDMDRADRLMATKGSAELADPAWSGRRDRWQAELLRLLGEFRSGQAAVAPVRGACRNCDLAALCRVAPAARLAQLSVDDSGPAS